jgi:hypothetical protein
VALVVPGTVERVTPPEAPAVDAETKGTAATPKEATVDDDFPTDREILTNPKAFDRAAARFNKDIESLGPARGSEGQTVKVIPHPTNKDAYGLEVTDEDGNKENIFSNRKDDWTLDEAKKQAGTQGGFHPAYRPREKKTELVDQEETPTQPPESAPAQPKAIHYNLSPATRPGPSPTGSSRRCLASSNRSNSSAIIAGWICSAARVR